MEGKKTCHVREACKLKETTREAKETFTRLHRIQYRTLFSSNDTLWFEDYLRTFSHVFISRVSFELKLCDTVCDAGE